MMLRDLGAGSPGKDPNLPCLFKEQRELGLRLDLMWRAKTAQDGLFDAGGQIMVLSAPWSRNRSVNHSSGQVGRNGAG